MTPRLALVPGEPGGIGPELCVRLAQRPRNDCTLLAFGELSLPIKGGKVLTTPA